MTDATKAVREVLASAGQWIYSRPELLRIIEGLLVHAENAEMFERRIRQMIGSNADDRRLR